MLSSLHSRSLSRQRTRSVGRSAGSSRSVSSAQHNRSSSGGGHEVVLGVPSTHKSNQITAISRRKMPVGQKFDLKTGRCKKHPSIILAKKSAFSKGWEMVKDECLLCNEAKKQQHKQYKSARGIEDQSRKSNDSHTTLIKKSTTESNHDIFLASVATTFTTCAAITTEGASEVEEPCHRSSYEGLVAAVKDTPPARVCRMPYTTPWGEIGWYTGTVNSRGIPNGQGRMRTKTGNMIEGKWTDGYSDDENLLRRNGKMKSGFGAKNDVGSAVRWASVPPASLGLVPNVGVLSNFSHGHPPRQCLP